MAGELEFHYDFSELDKCANNINTVIGDVAGISYDITNLRRNIMGNWNGDASNAYGERCISLLEKLRKLNEQMESNQRKLTRAVSTYRQNEFIQKQNIRNLSDEDIF